jgi:uracil phosphoribosyltransferase
MQMGSNSLSCARMCAQVVPILRAGLVLLDQAATVLPNAATYHAGYVRDEATLEVRPAAWCGPGLPLGA